MKKQKNKKISLPSPTFGTGGGGTIFETKVQSAFSILLLSKSFSPCLPAYPITNLLLQAKKDGYATDDLVVKVQCPKSNRFSSLLCQIKREVSITEKNKVLKKVIEEVWEDYNNKSKFDPASDRIALITGPLKGTDMQMRTVLEWAKTSPDEKHFFNQVSLANVSSGIKRAKFDVFQKLLKDANGGVALTDRELWDFLKVFHLLIFDLDIERGLNLVFLKAIIRQYDSQSAPSVWAMVLDKVQTLNLNGGVVTREQFDEEILEVFDKKREDQIPEEFVTSQTIETEKDVSRLSSSIELAILSILGGWNEANTKDTDIIGQITGESYPQWITKIRKLLTNGSKYVSLKDRIWKVSHRKELFNRCAHLLFDNHIEKFKNSAIYVLTRNDPKLELKPEERYLALVKGKSPEFSKYLHKGLSGGIALIGVNPEYLDNVTVNYRVSVAEVIVRKVLDSNDWKRWASLKTVASNLAEAAPNQFFEKIELALIASPSPFIELYKQESAGIGGTNYISGILWALEVLAWISEYLPQATVVLGKLDELDPGGNWGNRPLQSLTTIYLPWKSSTMANAKKKQAAIKPLVREHSQVAAKLFERLLPGITTTTSGTSKPKWRSPKDGVEWEYEVLKSEYHEQSSFFASQFVELASQKVVPIEVVARKIDHLTDKSFKDAFDQLGGTSFTSEEQLSIWKILGAIYRRHKKYASEPWSISQDRLSSLKKIIDQLTPTDQETLHREIFNKKDLDDDEDVDWQTQQERNAKKRAETAADMLKKKTFLQIKDFALTTEAPHSVGEALGKIIAGDKESVKDIVICLEANDNETKGFISAFVWQRYDSSGDVWIETLKLDSWDKKNVARLLIYLRFREDIWSIAKNLLGADESIYWKEVRVRAYNGVKRLDLAAEKLVMYGKPLGAINCLHTYYEDGNKIDSKFLTQTLVNAISSTEEHGPLTHYYLENLLKLFQSRQDIGADKRFLVEWAYLDIIENTASLSPKFLNKLLSENPKNFSDIIGYIYMPKNQKSKVADFSAKDQFNAKQGYTLLESWTRLPGISDDGDFDASRFQKWMNDAVDLLEKTDRLDVGLMSLGKVFLHAPADPDGLWIHKTVAERMNLQEMDVLRRNYSSAAYNSRGAHIVDPSGKPELKLSNDYLLKSEDVQDAGYHRFAATLRELSKQYEQEAEQVQQNRGLFE